MKQAYINAAIPFSNHDAFIVEEGMFTHVGKKASILNQSIDEIIDLKNQTVFPGFHDSHMHLVGLGMMQSIFNASNHKTIEALIEQAKMVEMNPLVGRGFHESTIEDGRMLNKADLDKISTDKPVIIYRVCGHMVVANSKAIEIATAQNGPIPYQKDSYDLNEGLFKEEAMQYVLSIIPIPDESIIESYVLSAQETLLSHGVTSVGSDDFHVTKAHYETVLNVLKTLSESGKLKLNVYEQVNLPNIDDFNDFLEKGYALQNYGLYKHGPLKLLADGSLGARSAYMKTPYADDPSTQGIAIFDKEKLIKHFKKASEYQMDFAIHGIGDGTIEAIMDAKEYILEIDDAKKRDSIIHAQLASHDQIKRMKSLDLGAQTQPIFIASDVPIIETRLGETRAQETYLFHTMIKNGIPTTISTDAPIESTNPFENLYVAVTRRSFKHPKHAPFIRKEAIPLSKAIKAYTEIPAYFTYQEKTLGKIQKGFQADFIVVQNFNPKVMESLLKTEVVKTYKQGTIVYER